MEYPVPFFPNEPDDNHCVQAAYRMILKYFLPDQDFSLADLSRLTGKPAKGGTWAAAGHLWLKRHGFEVIYWTLIDWPAFAGRGYDYLVEQFGREVADWQAKHDQLSQEQQRAAAAMDEIPVVRREPQAKDIIAFLDHGYLIKCTINARVLNNRDGYAGHVIIVKGYTAAEVIIHDPGLPPLPDRHVPFELFESAWAYPNKTAKELAAIKKL